MRKTILIFLASMIFQVSIGEEKNMSSQNFDGYKQINGISEMTLKESYSRINDNINIEESSDLFIFFINLYIKGNGVDDLKNIRGSVDITKHDQIIRTIDFDFSNQSFDVKSRDENGELETRVFLTNREFKAYVNLGNNDLKDIIITPKIFVKNTDLHTYSITPQVGVFRLDMADHMLRYYLNLPMPGIRLHSLNPNEYK